MREQRCRIFVVEDQQVEGYIWILERRGHSVAAFADSESALDFLQHDTRFDVFIVDLAISGIENGFELAQQLVEEKAIEPERFIFVTGWAAVHPPPELFENSPILEKGQGGLYERIYSAIRTILRTLPPVSDQNLSQ